MFIYKKKPIARTLTTNKVVKFTPFYILKTALDFVIFEKKIVF